MPLYLVVWPQVIEKAYKKLRLDALVIQQGRLTDNAAAKVGT
jgi:SWI/SNF-related matrix-associated actin-dependent regulator of chromatin subfamily A member 5